MSKTTIYAVEKRDPKTGTKADAGFTLEIPSDVIEGRYQRIENGAGFEMNIEFYDAASDTAEVQHYYCEAVSGS